MQSVSHIIKENLLHSDKFNQNNKKCCLKTIFLCFLSFKSFNLADNNKVELRIEEAYLANFISNVLKKLEVNFSKNKYTTSSGKVMYTFLMDSTILTKNINKLEQVPVKKCCKKNWLKVAFLSGGYLSDPSKNYHMEFCTSSLENIKVLNEILCIYEINSKYYQKKGEYGNYSLYIKKSDDIIKFLGLIGAFKQLLALENLKIEKEIRNKVTRQVNYEAANIEKTIESAVKYIDSIEWAVETGLFNDLPESLKEIATLRVKYPDKNLRELCELFHKPITKSGINHRLRRLYGIIQTEKCKLT